MPTGVVGVGGYVVGGSGSGFESAGRGVAAGVGGDVGGVVAVERGAGGGGGACGVAAWGVGAGVAARVEGGGWGVDGGRGGRVAGVVDGAVFGGVGLRRVGRSDDVEEQETGREGRGQTGWGRKNSERRERGEVGEQRGGDWRAERIDEAGGPGRREWGG